MKILRLLSFVVFIACSAKGAPPPSPSKPLQRDFRYGAYLSSLGDTVFGITSLNGAVNLNENFRGTLGLSLLPGGYFGVGLGAKYIILGNSPISPVVGVGISASSFFSGLYSSISQIFNTPGPHPNTLGFMGNASLGVEWQSEAGFNLGIGASGVLLGANVYLVPYLNVGWYFH